MGRTRARLPDALPRLARSSALAEAVRVAPEVVRRRREPSVALRVLGRSRGVAGLDHDERLPDSHVAIIDGGHFIWEEAPAEYAAIVLDSILRGLKPRA